jgi:DNA-directed RNA polymerase subunit RPC12/RpoP
MKVKIGNIEVEYICGKCGNKDLFDKNKSNQNWEVISMVCPKCKGRVKMNFGDKDGNI